jgi:hypothetical protein
MRVIILFVVDKSYNSSREHDMASHATKILGVRPSLPPIDVLQVGLQ